MAEQGATTAVRTLADSHEGDGHFLQVRNALFKVLERILDLQGEQAAQPGTVFDVVENLVRSLQHVLV